MTDAVSMPTAAPDPIDDVINLLGGADVFPKRPEGALAAHRLIEEGLPSGALTHLLDNIGLLADDPALDVTPHVLTRADIPDGSPIHVVRAESVPNDNWLHPCLPSAGQQAFGDALLAAHGCFLIPSVVSAHSWNFVFDAAKALGLIAGVEQERFALDTRLHPA